MSNYVRSNTRRIYIKKNVIFRIFELELITGIETIPLPPQMREEILERGIITF